MDVEKQDNAGNTLQEPRTGQESTVLEDPKEGQQPQDCPESSSGESQEPQEPLERKKTREEYPVTDLDKGIVAWDDQNDPLNPRNYPDSRKWFLLGIVSIITLISPFGSSVVAPAAADINAEFHNTSSTITSLVVTAYVLGYSTGPIFLSPLSEIYGRRIILNSATTIFVMFQIGCALSPNISALIVFRLLSGMGGSACLTIGGGVISDLFEPEQRGQAMAIFSFGPLFGPVLGPICGGFIAERIGWRWVFWILVIAGGTLTSLVVIFNRETSPVIIMRRKTLKMRKELNRPELVSFLDEKSEHRSPATILLRGLTRPLQILFRAPIVACIALYISTVYGCLYLLFTTVTGVFTKTYGWSTEISGLSYIGLGVGFLTGQAVFGVFSDRIIVKLKDANGGKFEPEMRLPLSIPFAFFVPISFFWYGWSVQAHTHWIVPIIGLFPFALGMIGIFATMQTYIVDCFPRYAASGIAAITITRSLFGTFLPLAGPPMYNALGYGWGNSLLGFVTLAMIPLPIFFNRYGAVLRKKVVINFD